MKKQIITRGLILAFALLTTAAYIAAADQPAKSTSAKWEPATVTAVKAHPPAGQEKATAVEYDVTVRVGDTEYVVLYAPPAGMQPDFVTYHVGMEGLVQVGAETMKYNDILGNTGELRIISSRTMAKSPGN